VYTHTDLTVHCGCVWVCSASPSLSHPPQQQQQSTRDANVQEYFYGVKDDLRVTTRTAAFHELAVFRVGGALRAPASALPLGADPVANPLRVQSVSVRPPPPPPLW